MSETPIHAPSSGDGAVLKPSYQLICSLWERDCPSTTGKGILSNGFLVFLIIMLNVGVYFPALRNVFVGDQIFYFAELKGSTSLADGLAHYDYSVSRKYLKGDNALFRPLLFVWLAVANHFFSYQYFYWNLANLCLHIGVTLLLFKVLYTIQPSIFAGLCVLLFSVMRPHIDLVLNNHLGGYLLAFICFLLGVLAVLNIVSEGGRSRASWLGWYGVVMTAGCFFYECLVPFVALLTLFAGFEIWRKEKVFPVRIACVLLAPCVIYFLGYFLHGQNTPQLGYVEVGDSQRSLFDPSHIAWALQTCPVVLSAWTLQTVFPVVLHGFETAGGGFSTLVILDQAPLRLIPNGIIVLCMVAGCAMGVKLQRIRRQWPFACLMVAMGVCYALILSLGRSGPFVSYYLYLFFLIVVILVYALLDLHVYEGTRKVVAIAGLVSFVALNHYLTSDTVDRIAYLNRRDDEYFTALIEFVSKHRDEPDFSFAIKNAPVDVDPAIELKEGYPSEKDAPSRTLRLSEILFHRYYNAEKAKYTINCETDEPPRPSNGN